MGRSLYRAVSALVAMAKSIFKGGSLRNYKLKALA
jgi:hypothetical protein